ncbi:MAG: hypothetical protein ACPGU7_12420 [Gammaproteobacteria bacterium]
MKRYTARRLMMVSGLLATLLLWSPNLWGAEGVHHGSGLFAPRDPGDGGFNEPNLFRYFATGAAGALRDLAPQGPQSTDRTSGAHAPVPVAGGVRG